PHGQPPGLELARTGRRERARARPRGLYERDGGGGAPDRSGHTRHRPAHQPHFPPRGDRSRIHRRQRPAIRFLQSRRPSGLRTVSVPRLGFVGLGWIGAMRLESVAASSRARIAAVCDAVPERVRAYADRFPEAIGFDAFDTMLERSEALGLDGVVIATPNALHVPQSLAALDRGLAVFCQKPLALDARGAREVVSAARGADRLLGVDFSYRYTEGAQALRRMVRSGELGRIFD